ncbi:MAG: transposase [Prochloron sp. SP5CPC1]|nr:transposase [Candidatus Paraprochloron terpiosi SP5CPC1]
MFLEWIEYFGTIFGGEIRSVAPHFTSQDCSQCGHRQKKSLSQRTHQCVKCGDPGGTHPPDQLHRDYNAALMILFKALGIDKNTECPSEINAWGENALCLELETVQGKTARCHRRCRRRRPKNPTAKAVPSRGSVNSSHEFDESKGG